MEQQSAVDKNPDKKTYSVGIVGATGYTGAELIRLISTHPYFEVAVLTSRQERGKKMSELYPNLRGFCDLVFCDPNDAETLAELKRCDVVFFATPHGVAQRTVKGLITNKDLEQGHYQGPLIVDLSADFRIRDIRVWERHYQLKHEAPELIQHAVYGLPEVNREAVKMAKLIACPGCYPTSIQLGLLPLIEADCIDRSTLIANSASGITGAGRKAATSLLFTENSDSFKPYSMSGHRHEPEIIQGLHDIATRTDNAKSDENIQLTFVPHLTPAHRGILSTIYARVDDCDRDYQSLFEQRYQDEPFIDVLPCGISPETRAVRGSNRIQISVTLRKEAGLLIVHVAEDNLCKGASGQAIQCANLALGLDERTGLDMPALIV